uniref:Uncharacterized protein n=1 Tax=viral metagenome TaxID=1070528 RepID=A0A6C0BKU5_9ZZZZ
MIISVTYYTVDALIGTYHRVLYIIIDSLTVLYYSLRW